jgi:hypothetical protein
MIMLVRNKKAFAKGSLLFVSFMVILVLMFIPLIDGKNALEAADQLFNSISKGSTHYIPDLVKQNQSFGGTTFEVSLKFKTDDIAKMAEKILTTNGAQVSPAGSQVKLTGDLGKTLGAALRDADSMFHNRDSDLSQRYGFGGREATYVWWNILKEVEKDLTRQQKFKEAAFVSTVVKRGVEVGFNFFGIAPESAGSKIGILTFALVFYVIYTLWWGIAILLLFEGIGLEMKAGAKKEV